MTHLLPPSPTDGTPSSTDVIILAADASLSPCFTPAEARALTKSHPDIKTAFVAGAAHSVHRDAPDVVLEVLLTGSVDGEGLVKTADLQE